MSSEDVPVAASIRDRSAAALLRAMKERDTVAVAALRSALAEIANAEAVPFTGDAAPVTGSQHVAGAAAGLRAAEVAAAGRPDPSGRTPSRVVRALTPGGPIRPATLVA